jgi:hypothetical protein
MYFTLVIFLSITSIQKYLQIAALVTAQSIDEVFLVNQSIED